MLLHRGRSGEKATQPRSPGKVLSADEIVRAKERERSRSASAAGLSARPGPSKSSRLDANALLDMASHRRVAPRPGVPPPHLSQVSQTCLRAPMKKKAEIGMGWASKTCS